MECEVCSVEVWSVECRVESGECGVLRMKCKVWSERCGGVECGV